MNLMEGYYRVLTSHICDIEGGVEKKRKSYCTAIRECAL